MIIIECSLYDIVLLVNNLEVNILFHAFQSKFYSRKYSYWTYVLSIALSTLLCYCINKMGNPVLNLFSYISIITITTKVMYNTQKTAFYIYNLGFVIGLLFIDIIVTSIVGLFITWSVNAWLENEIYYFISSIPILIFNIVYYNILTTKLSSRPSNSFRQNIILCATCSFETIVFIYIALNQSSREKTSFILIMLGTGFLAIVFYQLYAYKILESYNNEIKQREEEKLYQELMNRQYTLIEERNKKFQELEHDIDKHLNNIINLIKDGEIKVAEEYILQIKTKLEAFKGPYIFKNKVLQVIVNELYSRCYRMNVNLNLNVCDLEIHFIEAYDLTVILGNLIENALEACSRINKNDRFINFKLFEYRNYLIISIENSFDVFSHKKVEWKTVSSKDGHSPIGLNNVQSIIYKYDGEMKIECNESFFVKITIFEKEN